MRFLRKRHDNQVAGFSLIELMLVVAIIGILASVSGSKYLEFVKKARVARSIAEIRSISRALDAWVIDGTSLPESLARRHQVGEKLSHPFVFGVVYRDRKVVHAREERACRGGRHSRCVDSLILIFGHRGHPRRSSTG